MSHNNWELQPRCNGGQFSRKFICNKCKEKFEEIEINLFPSSSSFRRSKRNRKDSSFVYFIKCENFIKIGKSINPFKRLNALQASNPLDLDLIYYFFSDEIKEPDMQTFFYGHGKHHRREWFFYDDFTEKTIKILKKYEKAIKHIYFFEKGKFSINLDGYLLNLKQYKKNLRFIKNVENFFTGSYKKNRNVDDKTEFP